MTGNLPEPGRTPGIMKLRLGLSEFAWRSICDIR
jgi:hypothetical protein